MKLSLSRTGDEIASAKQTLRSEMRRKRAAIPRQAARRAARAAAEHVLGIADVRRATVVGLYADIGSELGTADLATELNARGLTLAYPRVHPRQRNLGFYRVRNPGELTTGPLRIPQPPAHAAAIPVEQIDVLVIPGLAFDRCGRRLGWGKGYYDCTIAAARHPLRIGYGHACQVVDEVPCASHDEFLDILVTDHGVVWTEARAQR